MFLTEPRLDRNRAARDRLQLGQRRAPGNIGLPAPGVELKLVPIEGKLEARLQGSEHHARLLARPELTADAFDEEGFYKIGDALNSPIPPIRQGLLFDGRLAEDFKLATGTWVSVGPLRAPFIDHCAPLVRDVVFAGADSRRNRRADLPRPRGLPQARRSRRRRCRRCRARRCRRCARVPRAARRARAQPAPAARPASAAPSCSPSRPRSTPAKRPTRARSTSARCSPAAPRWSKSFTPTRRPANVIAGRSNGQQGLIMEGHAAIVTGGGLRPRR